MSYRRTILSAGACPSSISATITGMRDGTEIQSKIKTIQNVFAIDSILEIRPDKKYIQKYYQANKLAYSLFHTRSDRMYMGVSRDGTYKADDLLEAARTVEKYIKAANAKSVLELASGRGATSAYLASRYPDVRFAGVELSPGQFDFALKKAKKYRNYIPAIGDYHDLSQFKNSSIDIVFVIEALCYSEQKEIVFEQVRRVLKPKGVFIVLDGYAKKDRISVTADELTAMRLTEIGMAVSEFEQNETVLGYAKESGFKVVSNEDVSECILPTLYRFERLAKWFFYWPSIARVLTRVLSKEFVYNVAPALLMPELIKGNVAGYFITVFKRG